MDTALAKLKLLKDVYQDSKEVTVGPDLKVILKVLNSEEETEAHGYAAEKYEQGISFLYGVKRETLCRAIQSLNGTELPDIIEDTDEESSEEEKVVRHIWLRENVIKGWNQLVIDELWKGYGDLLKDLEKRITGDIKQESEEEQEEDK